MDAGPWPAITRRGNFHLLTKAGKPWLVGDAAYGLVLATQKRGSITR